MIDAETGLYYNRARMLHATLGRFAQRDPLEYVGGVNLYGYARNTPILLRDPLGLLECNKDNEGERRGVALETVFSPGNNNNPGDTNRLLNFAIILLLISDIPIPGVTNPAEILRFFHANEPTGSSCRK
jgi:RHS repeat-associated protein